MKRLFITLLLLSFSFPLLAVLNGDGYYRVKNVTTGRYISVIDNRGHIDIASTTADFGAIRTIKYFDNIVSDPSTIIYFHQVGEGYDLTTQGTSTSKIIGYYMRLQAYEDGTYKAYGESHGMRAYLGDENIRDTIATVVSNNSKTTLWYILPVTQENESYFGIRPEYISDGAYWTTIYASFPFSPVSSDKKAYTITEVDSKYGVAVWNEVTTEEIPAATPVIVRCPSPIPSGNKVDVHTSSVKAPKSNLLQGVYFCKTIHLRCACSKQHPMVPFDSFVQQKHTCLPTKHTLRFLPEAQLNSALWIVLRTKRTLLSRKQERIPCVTCRTPFIMLTIQSHLSLPTAITVSVVWKRGVI